MDKHKFGTDCETVAANYLETQGYIIIDRNVKLRRGELDIIAREGGDIVFVEVKARRSSTFGSPFDAITPTKLKSLARAVREYVYNNLLTDESLRFDVVTVESTGDDMKIGLLKNAAELGEFLPD